MNLLNNAALMLLQERFIAAFPEKKPSAVAEGFWCYEQKRCLPMVTISGRDQIHLLVAVAGLK